MNDNPQDPKVIHLKEVTNVHVLKTHRQECTDNVTMILKELYDRALAGEITQLAACYSTTGEETGERISMTVNSMELLGSISMMQAELQRSIFRTSSTEFLTRGDDDT